MWDRPIRRPGPGTRVTTSAESAAGRLKLAMVAIVRVSLAVRAKGVAAIPSGRCGIGPSSPGRHGSPTTT